MISKIGYLLSFVLLCTLFACAPSLQGLQVQKLDTTKAYSQAGKTVKLPKKDATARVFYLVRHAEKELSGKDPNLTAEGKKRAERLAQILAEVPVTAAYSSDYARTRQTAAPTVIQKQLELQLFNPREQADFLEQLKREIAVGSHTLIVGHSNSTPNLLNLFAGKKVYEHISEKVYDNLFMVILSNDGSTEIIGFKY